jgi:hypothetical protein
MSAIKLYTIELFRYHDIFDLGPLKVTYIYQIHDVLCKHLVNNFYTAVHSNTHRIKLTWRSGI